MSALRLQAAGLVLGPVIFASSAFFWVDGHYGVTGGALIALAMVPWVFGLIGEYDRHKERLPTLSRLWLLLLLIGMLGSIGFGLQGFFDGMSGVDSKGPLDTLSHYPIQSVLVLWLPGPIFPLALLLYGIFLRWARLAPRWVTTLVILGAVGFPMSRALRTDWIAYITDVILILAFSERCWRAWRRPTSD